MAVHRLAQEKTMQSARILQLNDSNPGTVRFLSGLHVTLEEGKTTSWVTVTRTGSFSDPRYGKFEITRKMLQDMVANFDANVYGQDIFYDVAHRPDNGAAGKILKLKVEGDRLRALVEWTPLGVDAIKNKGYTYSSIEYHENFQDNESGNKHGPTMLGAGLVTRPCVKRLDPIQLSEAGDGAIPTLLHPELQSTLLAEITDMHKALIAQLMGILAGFHLAEPVVKSLTDAFSKAVDPITDEAAAKALMESFKESGKQLAEQIGDKVVTLSINMPQINGGMTEADVKKLMQAETERIANEAKQLTDKRDANVKILTDAINAVSGFDEDTKKQLAESVTDLITPDMTADQVKKLADNQISMGNQIAAAKKLSGMGFQLPAGTVHITVDSSNEIKALQEAADRRLG
jgi:translation initiation factor 6 (eIF-6)